MDTLLHASFGYVRGHNYWRRMDTRRLRTWGQAFLAAGVFGATIWLEHRRSLRKHKTEPKYSRVMRNLAVAGVTAASAYVVERPVVQPLAGMVERRRWGLLPRLRLPRQLETALAILLMDYTLYLWHVLLHRVPWLWRCHLVHHSDLELDASTALRFHFTEFLASIPYRAAQVIVIGVSPKALSAWQLVTGASVVFHHSNIQLPYHIERLLSRLIMSPRLHGIHHSIIPEETNSNFSSGLTLWDFLHQTVRMNVEQRDITIGIPAYRTPRDVSFPKVMKMPFNEEPSWQLPDGTTPSRPPNYISPAQLLP
jgi:sterol desaturase/sphingolipid hydroxylase (fatty acid hydroxylase superfamily)